MPFINSDSKTLQEIAASIKSTSALTSEMYMFMRARESKKRGSNLTSKDLKAFHFVDVIINNDNIRDHPLYNEINAALSIFLNNALFALKKSQMDEVKYVQPLSFTLLQTITDMISAHRKSIYHLTVCNKANNEEALWYNTKYALDDDDIRTVNGECDEIVMYRGVPILVWEDKNLNKTCDSVNDKCQVLAELKGHAENFAKIMERSPPLMYGILTSGRSWRAVSTFYSGRGHQFFTLSNCIEVICQKNDFLIDPNSVVVLTNLLVDILEVMMRLCDFIDTIFPAEIRTRFDIYDEDNRKDDNNDEDDNENDDPELYRSLCSTFSGMMTISQNSVASTSVAPVASASQSTNPKGTSTSRSVLSDVSQYVLTEDRLRKHTLLNPSKISGSGICSFSVI